MEGGREKLFRVIGVYRGLVLLACELQTPGYSEEFYTRASRMLTPT